MKRKQRTSGPSFLAQLAENYSSKLRLPRVFVQKYEEFLVEKTKLRTSSGATWIVKLEKRDDGGSYYCFTKGWSKFVEDLELEKHEFLVFRFDINVSTFDVSVYGTDWGEREIPIVGVDSDTDVDSKLNDDCCYIPVYEKNHCKREPSAMDVESDTDDDEHDDLRNNCSHNVVPGRQARVQQEMGSRERNCRSGGEIKSFSAILKYHNRFFMDIPKAFAVETGIARKREIKLQNAEGEEWHVEFPPNKCGRIRITKGWTRFFAENKLVVGSTCWFEFDAKSGNLIVKEELDLTKMSSSKRRRGGSPGSTKVPTKRERGRPPNSRRMKLEQSNSEECSSGCTKMQRGVLIETSIAYKKATAFASAHTFRNPFFISLMQPSYVTAATYLNVPLRLAGMCLRGERTNLTLRLENGKAWHVRCILKEDSRAHLSAGWKDFVLDNGLTVGDACIFEVAEDCVWKVIIFRNDN